MDTLDLALPIPEVFDEAMPYGVLAAWFSGYAFAEQYRKVIQAQCIEIERARAAEKTSETKLEIVARLHPIYLDYLARTLQGRILWERAFLAQGGMR